VEKNIPKQQISASKNLWTAKFGKNET